MGIYGGHGDEALSDQAMDGPSLAEAMVQSEQFAEELPATLPLSI